MLGISIWFPLTNSFVHVAQYISRAAEMDKSSTLPAFGEVAEDWGIDFHLLDGEILNGHAWSWFALIGSPVTLPFKPLLNRVGEFDRWSFTIIIAYWVLDEPLEAF